jgi:hypothetical protein
VRHSGSEYRGSRRDGYGILIRMFFNDHAPPHVHARYGEFEATNDLRTLEVRQGELPSRALNLVRECDSSGSDELIADVLPGAPTPEPRGTIVVLKCGLPALLTSRHSCRRFGN